MKENEIVFETLAACAKYGNVTVMAISSAIKKKRLKATRVGRNWHIRLKDYEEYLAKRWDRKTPKSRQGYLSATHVAEIAAEMLGRPYPVQHVYYLLRKGLVKGAKHGYSWIIHQDDVVKLIEAEKQADELAQKRA